MIAYNVDGKICREMTATLIHGPPASSYTARHYVQAQSLLPSGVRLSVHLSVTLVYCIHTAEDIVKPLVWPGSPITSFLTTAPEIIQRGLKIHGMGKFCDFRLKSPFISETVQDRLMVAMEH